jgi:hypothetical protein
MVFALFNLGAQEILILIVGGSCFAGVVAGVIVLVTLLTRRQNPDGVSSRLTRLEEENQRLREELEKVKRDQASGGL